MSSSSSKCPVDHSAQADACPVDHSSSSSPWSRFFSSTPDSKNPPAQPQAHPNGAPSNLPLDRETSSIPKADGGNWVYPSQAQFYAAMARKNHNPQAVDMKVIVPIHNAVNERAWAEVMKWEAGQGGEKCGGVKLVSFKGRPGERSLRARWKILLGYVASVVTASLMQVSHPSPGTHHHSIAMTGWLIAAALACDISSTFTLDIAGAPLQAICPSTSMYGPRLTTGKASSCAPSGSGNDGPGSFGVVLLLQTRCNHALEPVHARGPPSGPLV